MAGTVMQIISALGETLACLFAAVLYERRLSPFTKELFFFNQLHLWFSLDDAKYCETKKTNFDWFAAKSASISLVLLRQQPTLDSTA